MIGTTDGTPILPDEVRGELGRILASPTFARSRRLSQFLEFTVDLTLQGRAGEIKEHRIGSEVFGRGAEFDPQADTIVRTQAHRLRAALAAYYTTEGRGDPLVIEFAKGSYVPMIRENGPASPEPELRETDLLPAFKPAAVPTRWLGGLWVAFALLAGCVAGAAAVWWLRSDLVPVNAPAHVALPLFAQGTLNSGFGPVVLSPSGASVVFPVSEHSGARRLWLRSLQSMNAIGLAGTEDAGLAFWSPGEEEIGFFANGRLKVFRLSDGTIRDLCAAPLGRGGTWNRKGVILFTPQAANGRVYRVDAAGGTPKPVTSLDSTKKEIDHRWPEFLRDGQHFVYTVHAQEAEHNGIYLATLDGGPPVLLDRTLSQAHYAETDAGEFLLYVKDKSIRARLLNVSQRRLEGPEVTVVHGAFYMPATGASFSVARDRYLAYFSARGRESIPVQLDRSGRQVRELAEKALFESLVLTADGRHLAAEIALSDQDQSDIWTTVLDKPGLIRVTVDGGAQAVWGKDMRSVLFVSPVDGFLTLYRKAVGESESPAVLYRSRTAMFPTDLSRDGRYLALHMNNASTQMDLALLPLDPDSGRVTGEPVSLRHSRFIERGGYFAPGGRHIAYTSDESGVSEVYVEELPEGKSGEGKRWKVSSGGGVQPRWRRDQQELYYVSLGRSLMRVDVKSTAAGLEFSTPQHLMRTPASYEGDNKSPYAVSPQGEAFYFLNPTGTGFSQVSLLTGWTWLLPSHRR